MAVDNELLLDVARQGGPSAGRTLYALSGGGLGPEGSELREIQERIQQEAERRRFAAENRDFLQDLQRRRITTEVLDSDAERRQVRSANKDIEAIVRGYETGTLSRQQAEGAMLSARKEYGDAVLLRSPQAQRWFGIDKQIEEAKRQEIESFAEQVDMPTHFFQWDEQENRPVADQRQIQLEYVKGQMADLKLKPHSQRAQVIQKQYDTVAKEAQTYLDAEEEVPQALQTQLDTLRQEYFSTFGDMRGALGMEQPFKQKQQQPKGPPPKSVEEAIAEPSAPLPSPDMKRYTRTEIQAAAQSGELGDTPVFLEGVGVVKLNKTTGKLERVDTVGMVASPAPTRRYRSPRSG